MPLIRSLITSVFGGGPEGGTTLGLVFSAAGSGVVLVLVAEVEVEAELDVELAVVDGGGGSPG